MLEHLYLAIYFRIFLYGTRLDAELKIFSPGLYEIPLVGKLNLFVLVQYLRNLGRAKLALVSYLCCCIVVTIAPLKLLS